MRTIRQFYLLLKPFWFTRHGGVLWLLLLSTLSMILGQVWVSVQYANWSRRFYDALAEYFQHDSPWNLCIQYMGYTTAFVLMIISGNWLRKKLIICVRQKMALRFESRWLRHHAHYRVCQLGQLDNPDQRIAEDVRLFVEQTVLLFLSFMKHISQLGSFIVLLWQLSGVHTVVVYGMHMAIYGYLVWVALIYAAVSSYLTHRIGGKLHFLNKRKQQVEADYRSGLMRIQENSEQIALYQGERAELKRVHYFFGAIVSNWKALMARELGLDSFTTSYFRFSLILPVFVVLPLYLTRQITLGGIMQVRSAFGYVLDAFGWFIDSYRDVIAWSATLDRLTEFDRYLQEIPVIRQRHCDGKHFICTDYSPVSLQHRPLIKPISQILSPGDWMMIYGPSGIGKTSFLRGLAGLGCPATGEVTLPVGRHLFLPQKPYLPDDYLKNILIYPSTRYLPDTVYVHALNRVGLPQLVNQLNDKQPWGRILSGGEQQRLSVARAIINAPSFLCMDEATSNLDDKSASTLLGVIKEDLPECIVIAVSHQMILRQHFNLLCEARPSDHRDSWTEEASRYFSLRGRRG